MQRLKVNHSSWLMATGLIFIATSVVAYFVAEAIIEKEKQVKTWPSTSGIITSSEIEFVRSGPRAGHTVAEPRIEYAYRIGDRVIRGGKVEVNFENFKVDWPGIYKRSKAEVVVEKYPKGKTVQVFYDPKRPSDAVLEIHRSSPNLRLLSPLCLVVGLLLFVIGFRKRGRDAAQPIIAPDAAPRRR